jgi:septal ring factor EnvC (AmiA/AmiB activator)
MLLKKLKIIFFIVIFIVLFIGTIKSAAAVSPFIKNRSAFYKNSLSIINKLKLYKLSLNKFYKDLRKKKNESNKLNYKIKHLRIKLKKLKKKIKNSGYIITQLLRDIFIINKEKNADIINLSDKNNNYFIANYILKNLLNNEEYKLKKLINRNKKFANIKKEIVIERKRLKKGIDSLSQSKLKLKNMISDSQNYISNVKKMKTKKSAANNKKSRFLRKKVIKLIHKIKSKIRHRKDIKFIVVK